MRFVLRALITVALAFSVAAPVQAAVPAYCNYSYQPVPLPWGGSNYVTGSSYDQRSAVGYTPPSWGSVYNDTVMLVKVSNNNTFVHVIRFTRNVGGSGAFDGAWFPLGTATTYNQPEIHTGSYPDGTSYTLIRIRGSDGNVWQQVSHYGYGFPGWWQYAGPAGEWIPNGVKLTSRPVDGMTYQINRDSWSGDMIYRCG